MGGSEFGGFNVESEASKSIKSILTRLLSYSTILHSLLPIISARTNTILKMMVPDWISNDNGSVLDLCQKLGK